MTAAGLKNTEEDEEEDATASLAAANKTSTGAAVEASDVFTRRRRNGTGGFSWRRCFDSRLNMARRARQMSPLELLLPGLAGS